MSGDALKILTVDCPKCGAKNIFHFISYYDDKCFNCDYDIIKHAHSKLFAKNKKKKLEILLEEVRSLEPEDDYHVVRAAKIELGLIDNIKKTNYILAKIENFDIEML